MFRLVMVTTEGPFPEDEIIRCISQAVSQTILDGMAFMFQAEDDYEGFFLRMGDVGFFKGIGRYYKTTDWKAGYEIFRRKLERMKQKMEDPAEYYTFDLLEELILYVLIEICETYSEVGAPDWVALAQKNAAREKQLADRLISEFNCDEENAADIAGQACSIQKMILDEDEDENLIFWDDDYIFYFQEGFIAGIKHMLAFEGESTGYGYQYVVKLFEDIGLKAPLQLIGTEEAHRVANELTRKRYYESLNKRLEGYVDEVEDMAEDEELPFS